MLKNKTVVLGITGTDRPVRSLLPEEDRSDPEEARSGGVLGTGEEDR